MRFYLENLLSKWGFEDGGVLDDLIYENKIDIDNRDLLVAVVKELVLPKIEDTVEVETITTIHNPIRATLVNGQQVNDTGENDIKFSVEFIDVDDSEIIKLAKSST